MGAYAHTAPTLDHLMHRFSLIVALGLCAPLCASASAAAPSAAAQCAAVQGLRYPAADFPSPAQARRLHNCDASNLYRGIGQPKNVELARQCALLAGDEDAAYGAKPGVLMMVYANGDGVARNLPLARKAACAADGAPAELAGRLEHLAALRPGQRIDVCDDITSGMMMGYCSAIEAAQHGAARESTLSRIVASFSTTERAAFARLRQRADAYIAARGEYELDLSGSARGAIMQGEIDEQHAGFLRALQQFERGALPRANAAAYQKLDRQLNAVYARVRAQPAPGYQGAPTAAGVLQVQRRWLAYRDAWVEFGKLRYPAAAPDAWRAHFTEERIKLLEQLME